jgi:GPH family glycoside/pentoside/hexuronide:cation symporter
MKPGSQGSAGGTLRRRVQNVGRALTWGLGGASDNLLYNGLNTLIFPIFNLALGMSAGVLGILSMIPRLLDAVTDPLMGYVSDRTRTRFGRRRPYILAGSILAGLLFFAIFLPGRSWSQMAVMVYYLPVLAAFYLAYTVFMIPYTALGFELTDDPDKRVRFLAWRGYIGLLAGLGIPFLYKACFWFSEDEVEGVKWVAAGVAGFVILVGFVIFFGLRERPAQADAAIPMREALLMTFKNPRFIYISGCFLTTLFGTFIAMPLVVYINNFYMFDGDRTAAALWFGWYGSAKMLGGFVGAVTVAHLPFSRFRMARCLLIFAFVSIVTSWWTFSPTFPVLQVIAGFVWGFSVNALFLLCTSFLADICDLEAMETGLSRQGFYAASLEFAKKLAISLSTLVSGFAIVFAGVDGVESVQDPTRLRMVFILILGSNLLLAFVFFRFFESSARKPIERMIELRRTQSA